VLDGKAEKWKPVPVKTTIDLPDPLFRRAKATAAVEGVTLKHFITQAVAQKLDAAPKTDWREVIANLPRVPKETTDAVLRSVAEADAIELAFQKQRASVAK